MEQSNCYILSEQNITLSAQFKKQKVEGVRKALTWLKFNLARLGKGVLRRFGIYQELYISKRQDRQGNPDDRVYDPIDNINHIFISEESVWIWLEEHHGQGDLCQCSSPRHQQNIFSQSYLGWVSPPGIRPAFWQSCN
ncbi:hypothetical protein [Myxosarcina sp. GI1(2024)]